MAILKTVGSEGAGECLSLERRETSIGRVPTCDIIVSGALVSRMHAKILREADGYYLEDLDSSNGTYVNGERITGRHRFANGDVFSVHDAQFQFWEMSLEEETQRPPRSALAETHVAALREIDSIAPANVIRALDAHHEDISRFDVNPAAKLRAILEMTRSLGTSLILEDVLPKILDGLFNIFPEADRGYILLRDGEDDDVFPYATKYRNEHEDEGETMPPISRTIARRVMQDRKAILSSDATTDDRFKHIASVHDMSIRSMMAAPLLGLHEEPVGVIHLDRKDPISSFQVDDLEVLVSAASLASHAVAYTQLHQERLNERQQADERFRRLLESAPDAVVVIDRTGRIALVNAETERLFGYPRAEILGEEVERLIPQQRRATPSADRIRSPSDTQLQLPGTGLIGLRKNGSEFPVEISLNPLETDEGTLVFIAIRDMTAIKQAQKKALQAQRLAAIGEMMAGLAHESRNALQRSQSCLEMLELQVADRPKAFQLIARLQEAQDHLHRLYEDVRQYAAPVQPNRQVCHLNEVLQTAWDHLQAVRGKRQARLNVEPTTMDLQCDVDAFQLQQVFRNILENSLAASADPVEITAKWGHTELHGRPALGVSLRDNGPGLTDEQRLRMFEPFFTTKTHGTGLGMAIAKRIVEEHGGRLQVGKDPPPGAELLVILPRRET